MKKYTKRTCMFHNWAMPGSKFPNGLHCMDCGYILPYDDISDERAEMFAVRKELQGESGTNFRSKFRIHRKRYLKNKK